ncbi:MAG: helix-turn-helix domain-containing protein [Candidatus Woesearchaeota archaeon]
MNEELVTVLKRLNLSEYESRIYLALLELGESTSGAILSKSQINSGKIYLILESLEQKGLATEIVKNNVRHFRAVDPRSISKYLDQAQQDVDAQKKLYQTLLPQLLTYASASPTTPEIRVYTGIEGMKSAFDEEMLCYAQQKELLIYGIIDYDMHDQRLVRYFTSTIFPTRESKKLKIRKIISAHAKENIIEKGVTRRFIDYDSYFTYNIINDLVIFAVWCKEPLFITIRSTEVSNGLRSNFNAIWKSAKKK